MLALLGNGLAHAAQTDNPGTGKSQDPQRFEKNLTRGEAVPAWVEQDQGSQIADANTAAPLVVRLSDVQMYVDKPSTTYVHRMTQVNEASMLAQVGRIEIPFHPEYQRVGLHSLRVLRGASVFDKTTTADIRYLQMESDLDSGIFTGSVTASIVIDDIRVGDIVDIAYSTTGQNPVFDGNFFQTTLWDNTFPTLRKRIRLSSPINRPINYRVIGQGNGTIQTREEQVAGRKITTLSAGPMKAVEYELYVPRDVFQFRAIQFSEFSQWQQVSLWAQNLFDVNTTSADVEKVVASLRGAATSDETVQQALAYVQNEIRYLSISIGENSHKPFPPDVVLARRYGDCKDKSLLLVTILRKLGIEASPVLISASNPKLAGKMLPTPLAFDHAIVRARVNGKTYYLDPTRAAQYGPLANMGQVHEGAEVLVIQKDTHDLAVVPKKEEGTQTINGRVEKIRLQKFDGLADFKLIHQYSGVEAEQVRYYLARQTREQIKSGYIASVLRRYPNAELRSGPTVTDNRQANTLNIELNFEIPGMLEKTATGWQLRYQASNMRERFVLPENPKRTQALMVAGHTPLIRYDLEISLPEEINANYTPSTSKINNAAFQASEVLTFKANVFRASVELRMLKDRVAPQEVVEFMADTRKFGMMLEGAANVRKTDLREAPDRKPVTDLPLKQRISEQLEESIRSKTRLINEARANGSNAGIALCERGLSYARMGRKSDASADLQALQKEALDTQVSLRCRAKIYFAIGDFKNSESDAGRLLAQGTVDGDVHMLRGMSLFALAKWRDAADSFALAADHSNAGRTKLRANIMRQLALKRQNPQATLTSTIDSGDDWLNDMLAATNTGGKSEDQILHQVHKRTGDELDAALAEAYFYIGQLNIISGNKIKAMVYIQRSVEKGMLTAEYRPLAEFEAERLKKNK
ncbi:DUF3857 domain-containing transglutaminase family protein [Undibacterium sp. CY18W]|uniref:DUF3857 domain-containing transglutaminase family protein n=1 Tax=Undibacterium hunanense TaxID=2762292 RepID=A0ABR6ZT01_9BURK|nr:DUF3857 domain-containing transglutaminase family protein [Undibacterium hunanense]MBC3918939.1 DUF3857 domain-containing transglutaminase family protein [Undibacterium hunanense]